MVSNNTVCLQNDANVVELTKDSSWLTIEEASRQLQCRQNEFLKFLNRSGLESEYPGYFKKLSEPRKESKTLYHPNLLSLVANIRRGKTAIRPNGWLNRKKIYASLNFNCRNGGGYSIRTLDFILTAIRQDFGKDYQAREMAKFANPATGKIEEYFSPAIVETIKTYFERKLIIPNNWTNWEEIRLQGYSEKNIKNLQKILPEEWNKRLIRRSDYYLPIRTYSPEFVNKLSELSQKN